MDRQGQVVVAPVFGFNISFAEEYVLAEASFPYSGLSYYCVIDREGATVWSSEWLRSNSCNPPEGASEPCRAVWEDLLQGKLGGFTLGESMVQLQKSGPPLRVYPDGIGPVDSSLRLEFAYYEPTGDDRIEYITVTDFDIGGIHPGMNAGQIETLLGPAAATLQSGTLFYEGISLPDHGGTICIEFHFDEDGLLAGLELYLGW